ncbi:MAG: cytochrome c [Gammaproteobacteria bacterium]|nr:cytochrome c [Gammaproteobacteria bacterium]MCP4089515.1 cytochrome c [Gammaproteobacteria bacterium]MCP4276221.1 cytochrome c [Gammaproteobacteria bacterium]MCP4832918.1 cytochrome c [Gammaproteobacteria bacterium]MCP4930043.1 cytochrome c [Gammaproteobacteria bacterium]
MNNSPIKYVLRLLGLVAVMLFISFAVLKIILPQIAEPKVFKIVSTPDVMERGEYLFNSVLGCPVCHSERDWSAIGAPPMPPIGAGRSCRESDQSPLGLAEGGGFPGTICFRNITSDDATGVGEWTDGELMRAIREGIDRDDNAMFPIMPYFIYAALSDADTKAVIAYLRTLPPVDHPLPETDINFPVGLAISLIPMPVRDVVNHPDQADGIKYGEYLAKVARCQFCHTRRNSRNRLPDMAYEFSGGVKFQGREGYFYSTNLTPHETGLGDVSLEEFIQLFRRKPGQATGEIDIMPWANFSGMTDADLGAIYGYLQSLPPKPTGGIEEL